MTYPIRAFVKKRRYDGDGWDFYINSTEVYATAKKRDTGGYTVRRYNNRLFTGCALGVARTLTQAIEITKADYAEVHAGHPAQRKVSRASLSSLSMTAGFEKTVDYVIDDAILKHWVGIGWIEQRLATPKDYAKYPVCVDEVFRGVKKV